MTVLRKRMLEELQRRRYSSETIRLYLSSVKQFATYFGKRPDRLGSEHLRQYQLYLLSNAICELRLYVLRAKTNADYVGGHAPQHGCH